MADKKYIGKPGKQDDPCWKGYEMVGMKKKNGKKVPNCVPEATDILAKAKQLAEAKYKKNRKKDWTGAKPEKDAIVMDEAHENCGTPDCCGQCDTAIDEALTRATTGNPGYGYHGNVEAKDDAERDKRYSAMHRYTKQLVAPHLQDAKKPNVMVKHFLDSTHGRHIAQEPTDNNIKSRFKHFAKSYKPEMHEEVELDEAAYSHRDYASHGLMHPDMAKHMKKGNEVDYYLPGTGDKHSGIVSVNNGASVHIRAHKDGKIGAGPLHKFKVTPHLPKKTNEEVDIDEANLTGLPKSTAEKNKQYIEITHHLGHKKRVPVHPLMAYKALNRYRNDPSTKSARIVSEEQIEEAYGMWKVEFPKQHVGKPVAAGMVHVKAQNVAHAHKVAAKRVGVDHKVFKSKVSKSTTLPEGVQLDEVLGKDNEWGRPELRKKFAKVTPGQETMEADEIPTFDARYDDVTTQYCGGIREGYLAEISARGAQARAKFQAKLHKTLNDPAAIKRAKKSLAKKKAEDKAKEPPHLVMQLRKAVSIGSKVHFKDGSHHSIAPNHADRFMHKYNSAKSSIEKEALQNRAHKSHAEFMKTIAEAIQTPQGSGPEHESHMGNGGYVEVGGQTDKPCTCDITPANYPTAGQVSPEPELGDMNNDGVENEWDEVAVEADVTNEIENSSWQDLMKYYDSEDEDEDEGEDLEEAITPAGRLKKKFNAMRTKTRRNMARNMALKRIATPDKIKSRSIRAARRMVYQRLLRNRDISTVSAAEKSRLESQVKRMAPTVARLSIRLQQKERKIDQQRVSNSRGKKK